MEMDGGLSSIPSFALAKAVTVPTSTEEHQKQVQRQLAQQLEEADPTTYLTHFSKSARLPSTNAAQMELLASADSTNGICLFSRQTLDFVGRITGHEDTITHISFAKNNPSILWSASHDGTLRCWDLRTQALAHMFCGTRRSITPLFFALSFFYPRPAGKRPMLIWCLPLLSLFTANEPVESFDIGGTDDMVLAAGVKVRARHSV
jgi:WD40 repeat protein